MHADYHLRCSAQVVGKAINQLVGASSIIRRNETNLGDFTCDSLVASVAAINNGTFEKEKGKTSICLMNAGGIRGTIEAGEGERACCTATSCYDCVR